MCFLTAAASSLLRWSASPRVTRPASLIKAVCMWQNDSCFRSPRSPYHGRAGHSSQVSTRRPLPSSAQTPYNLASCQLRPELGLKNMYAYRSYNADAVVGLSASPATCNNALLSRVESGPDAGPFEILIAIRVASCHTDTHHGTPVRRRQRSCWGHSVSPDVLAWIARRPSMDPYHTTICPASSAPNYWVVHSHNRRLIARGPSLRRML